MGCKPWLDPSWMGVWRDGFGSGWVCAGDKRGGWVAGLGLECGGGL